MLRGDPPAKRKAEINTGQDLRNAIGASHPRPSHTTYTVTEKARREMRNWDFDERALAHWVLSHPGQVPNIKANYTRADIGVEGQTETYEDYMRRIASG